MIIQKPRFVMSKQGKQRKCPLRLEFLLSNSASDIKSTWLLRASVFHRVASPKTLILFLLCSRCQQWRTRSDHQCSVCLCIQHLHLRVPGHSPLWPGPAQPSPSGRHPTRSLDQWVGFKPSNHKTYWNHNSRSIISVLSALSKTEFLDTYRTVIVERVKEREGEQWHRGRTRTINPVDNLLIKAIL